MAKAAKKRVKRREYTKKDLPELKRQSKAKTHTAKVSKLTKKTVRALKRKTVYIQDLETFIESINTLIEENIKIKLDNESYFYGQVWEAQKDAVEKLKVLLNIKGGKI